MEHRTPPLSWDLMGETTGEGETADGRELTSESSALARRTVEVDDELACRQWS